MAPFEEPVTVVPISRRPLYSTTTLTDTITNCRPLRVFSRTSPSQVAPVVRSCIDRCYCKACCCVSEYRAWIATPHQKKKEKKKTPSRRTFVPVSSTSVIFPNTALSRASRSLFRSRSFQCHESPPLNFGSVAAMVAASCLLCACRVELPEGRRRSEGGHQNVD